MKWLEEPEKIRRRFDGEVINVARNPIEAVPNAPLASTPGEELHPPILGTQDICGGQVKRDILYSI